MLFRKEVLKNKPNNILGTSYMYMTNTYIDDIILFEAEFIVIMSIKVDKGFSSPSPSLHHTQITI